MEKFSNNRLHYLNILKLNNSNDIDHTFQTKQIQKIKIPDINYTNIDNPEARKKSLIEEFIAI
jgi:hypothetical protein